MVFMNFEVSSFPDFSRSVKWDFHDFTCFYTFSIRWNFQKPRELKKMNKTGEPENGWPQECCVFVTVSVFSSNFGPAFSSCFWCLVLLALTPFSFSCFCVRVGVLALSLFRFSSSLCQSLLSPRCCGWLWLGACPHPARESRDALLPPLPLTKKTLL